MRTVPPPVSPEASTVAPTSNTSRLSRSTEPPTEPVALCRPLLYSRPVLPPSMRSCPPEPAALLTDTAAAAVAMYDCVKAMST